MPIDPNSSNPRGEKSFAASSEREGGSALAYQMATPGAPLPSDFDHEQHAHKGARSSAWARWRGPPPPPLLLPPFYAP